MMPMPGQWNWKWSKVFRSFTFYVCIYVCLFDSCVMRAKLKRQKNGMKKEIEEDQLSN